MGSIKKSNYFALIEEDYDFLKTVEDTKIIALALESADFYAHDAITWNPLLSGEQIERLYDIHQNNLLGQLRLLIAPNLTKELIHRIIAYGSVKDVRKGIAVRHSNASEESKAILALSN